jgi:hypothetical protein
MKPSPCLPDKAVQEYLPMKQPFVFSFQQNDHADSSNKTYKAKEIIEKENDFNPLTDSRRSLFCLSIPINYGLRNTYQAIPSYRHSYSV